MRVVFSNVYELARPMTHVNLFTDFFLKKVIFPQNWRSSPNKTPNANTWYKHPFCMNTVWMNMIVTISALFRWPAYQQLLTTYRDNRCLMARRVWMWPDYNRPVGDFSLGKNSKSQQPENSKISFRSKWLLEKSFGRQLISALARPHDGIMNKYWPKMREKMA